SLVVATFAAVVLAVYVYGIRRIGDWAQSHYGVRAGVIEAILILALTLLAAPMRSSLEKWFRSLFERETSLYRDVVARVGAEIGQFRELSDLVAFLENQIVTALPVRRVKIILDSDEVAKSESGYEQKQTSLATDFD